MRWPWSRRRPLAERAAPESVPPRPFCPVHDGARVLYEHPVDHVETVAFGPTLAHLLDLERDGSMRLVRGDCRLDQLAAFAEREALYSFALYLRCGACGALLRLDLMVRSSYQHYVEVPESELETTLFHDWPALVDTRPDLPLRLQPGPSSA